MKGQFFSILIKRILTRILTTKKKLHMICSRERNERWNERWNEYRTYPLKVAFSPAVPALAWVHCLNWSVAEDSAQRPGPTKATKPLDKWQAGRSCSLFATVLATSSVGRPGSDSATEALWYVSTVSYSPRYTASLDPPIRPRTPFSSSASLERKFYCEFCAWSSSIPFPRASSTDNE